MIVADSHQGHGLRSSRGVMGRDTSRDAASPATIHESYPQSDPNKGFFSTPDNIGRDDPVDIGQHSPETPANHNP